MNHISLDENELPQGFNLLEIGKSPQDTYKSNIYTSSIETVDLSCNYCEYQGSYMTLCIKLKRQMPPRINLFNFIAESEAYSKSLIGEGALAYYIDNWLPAHIIFVIPTFDMTNPHRAANFIVTGLQVRVEATVNQADLITLNFTRKEKARLLKVAQLLS